SILDPSNGGSRPLAGTSLAAPGPFAIRGIPQDGRDYNLFVWRDSLGQGSSNYAADPMGSQPVKLSAGHYSGASVTLADPPALSAPTPTEYDGAFPGDHVLVFAAKVPRDNQDRALADHMTVYVSTTANPGPSNNVLKQTAFVNSPIQIVGP